jgi:hypothetical protein
VERGGQNDWPGGGRQAAAAAMLERFYFWLGGWVGWVVTNVLTLFGAGCNTSNERIGTGDGLFQKLKPHEAGGSDGAKE